MSEPSKEELDEIQTRWQGWRENFQEFLKVVGHGHYILEGTEPKEVSLIEAAEWMEANNEKRQIARDERGGVTVSTVFLCFDHNFGPGPPVLFETMVFGGEHDGEMERYTTYADALVGHDEMLVRVWGPEAHVLEAEFIS